MPTPDDADFVRRDHRMPGLAVLLDGDALVAELSARGVEGLEALAPCYVRYKPGTSCLVGYRAVRGGSEIRVHATTWSEGSIDKTRKAMARSIRPDRTWKPPAEGGSVYLERGRATVSFFPYDADLPALERLGDPERLGSLLGRIFRDDPSAVEASVDRLAYKPGRRFVGRAIWPDGRSAVVRLYSDAARARALRVPAAFEQGELLRVARRVGGSKRHAAAAVEWIPGVTLRDAIRSHEPLDGRILELVARSLAEFHRTKVDRESHSLAPRGVFDGLGQVERELAWLLPQHEKKLAELRTRLEAGLAGVALERRPIHGDLYDKQIVLSDDGVGVVDLDELGCGDPRQDIGLFLAHWERDRLLGELDPERFEGASRLVGRYREAAGDDLGALPVFVAAALFRLAQQPFRTRLSGWPTKVTALIERVEELLAS